MRFLLTVLATLMFAAATRADDLEELAAALRSRGDKTYVRVAKPADLIQLFIKDAIDGKIALPTKDGQAFIKNGKLFLKPTKGEPVEVDRTLWFWVVESMMGGKFDETVAFVPMPLYARYAARLNAEQRKKVVPEKIKVQPTDK